MDKIVDFGATSIDEEKIIYLYKYKGKGVDGMILKTMYMENLPNPNYKTKQFTKGIEETLPDDISKEELIKRSDRQSAVVEAFVKADIERHIAAQG